MLNKKQLGLAAAAASASTFSAQFAFNGNAVDMGVGNYEANPAQAARPEQSLKI